MSERKRCIVWIVLGVIVVLTAACSPASPTTPPTAPEATAATAAIAPPTEPAPAAPATEPAPTVEPTQPPKLLVDVPGVQEIALTTPQEGAGIKPHFTWEPLDGAARYTLVLYTAGREPYWAWEGAATSVYLGGSDTPPREDSAGPVLSAGMSWAVMAFGSDDRLIGSSVLRPISP